jgi:DNA repair protein SbcC/Rad50
MKLHSLTITAFGPFGDTQHVDFDALSAGGLFLFHGPTGAGKTSILDAVCFALYGQLPGSRSGSRSLRSDHAAPGVGPEVVLETTLRGRRFRLTRKAAWDRPKLRGSGTVAEQSHILLEERDGDGWMLLTNRLDEAGHLLGRLLGLTMTQFCQVVLLPQGQFAEFLRADADRRRVLLESLFDTQRFSEVERWLVERRKESSRALEQVDVVLSEVLARVAQASGATTAPGEVSAADAVDWVAALVTEAAETVAGLAVLSESLDQQRAGALAARNNGAQLQEQRTRHAALTLRMDKVTGEAAQRAAVAAELQAARRAAPVLPLVVEVARLDQTLALASGEVRVHQERLTALGSSIQVGSTGAARLRTQVDATQTELGALDQLLDDEAEARELAAGIEKLTRDVVALAQQRDKIASWLSEAEPRLPELRQAVEDAQRAGDRLAATEANAGAFAAQHAAAQQRDALGNAVTEARDLLRDAVDLAQTRKAALLDARTARIQGMAAELAATLADEQACPVCGSHDHPAPARGGASLVTREDEESAELDAAVADEARATVEAGLAALVTQQAVAAAAAGDVPLHEIAAALSSARQELSRLTDSANGLDRARQALAAFEAEADKRAQEQLRLDALTLTSAERATASEQRLQRLQIRLDAARGDDPSVLDRRARLSALVVHLGGLVDAVAAVDRLAGEVSAARRRAAKSATEHGLEGLEAVIASSRPEPVVVELEAFRRRHDEELAALTEMITDETLVGAVALPAPDLVGLALAAETADRAFTDHLATLSAAKKVVAQLGRLQTRLVAVLADRAPLADAHAVVDSLSRLAEGKSIDNRLRMSLSGYVLAARLEQVAVAASERLQRMSSGRYRLAHTTAGGGARARGGLHLRVLDEWTGADRDPSSLSGGESFSASLALALGLADVVSQEAGGSLLETLFVDEGFGSLDEDTLDEVMGVLDDLREGGRVVGLVSHVADLRQRIPVQLRVDKSRTGSTVEQ